MARVALCISGAFRGENFVEDLSGLIANVAKPFAADVFIASWDNYKTWMGLRGGAPGWLRISYSQNLVDMAPKEIVVFNADFKDRCPNIYKKLNSEVNKRITSKILKSIQNLPNVKGVHLSNEEEFLKQYPCKLDSSTSLKLTYNYTQVAKLLKNYEKEQNFTYDYIIHIRPDYQYQVKFNHQTLQTLKDNQLYIALIGKGTGAMECQFFGKRYAVLELLHLFEKAEEYPHLEFFKAFRDGGVCCVYQRGNGAYDGSIDHGLLYRTLEFLGLEQINCREVFPEIRVKLNPKMPPLQEEIEKDREHWKKIGLKDFGYFFEVLACEKFLKSQSAEERIKNQLSYKLGNAIANTPLYQLPFCLLNLQKQHKSDVKLYEKLLLKYPNLKLPTLESYEDYKEAIALKSSLYYKLGKDAIQAYKTWYRGGGIIKLLFAMIKLKKTSKVADANI